MTDQPTPDDLINADKIHRILLKAGSQFSEHGVTSQQAATGTLWAAIDFAAVEIAPPLIVEWLRQIADHLERGLLAKAALPVLH